MAPINLFREEVVTGSGSGPEIDLGNNKGTPLQLSLSITRMVERQTLDICIWGSANGRDWGTRPLLTLPHRYYCGNYPQTLDLTNTPSVRFLKAEYRLDDWGHSASKQLVSFHLTAEPVLEAELALSAG